MKRIAKYCFLVLSLVGIYLFGDFALPFLDEKLGFKEAHDILKEEKIEAGAWYYIFVEKVGPSSENIRHSLKFNPESREDEN